MYYTLVVGVHAITIEAGKVKGSRKFYTGKTLRYYVKGAVTGNRDRLISRMMSHAYENGETLLSLSKWKE